MIANIDFLSLRQRAQSTQEERIIEYILLLETTIAEQGHTNVFAATVITEKFFENEFPILRAFTENDILSALNDIEEGTRSNNGALAGSAYARLEEAIEFLIQQWEDLEQLANYGDSLEVEVPMIGSKEWEQERECNEINLRHYQ